MIRVLRVLFVLVFSMTFLGGCDDDEPAPTDVGGDPDVIDDLVPDAEDVTPDEGDAVSDADAGGFDGFPIEEPGPITDLVIDGLSAPVEIKLTADGIPSISCQSDADCIAALGYMHARDRFSQMDIRRRVVRGRLSEIVAAGEDILEVDVASRSLFSAPDGTPIEEVLVDNASEATMELLEAYSAGVNAWLDDLRYGENGASLPQEYGFDLVILGDAIAPWTPEDSMASVAALVESLTNDGSTDLSYGEIFQNIAADEDYDLTVFNDYFRPWPFSQSTIIDDYTYPSEKSLGIAASGAQHLLRGASAMRQARESIDRIHAILGVAADRGSNNWVVGPDMTASGDPLFSNDPHLGFSNPSVWYIAHMDASTNGDGDYHVAGLTFAGLPWVIIGQNENIAWGATNTSLDLSDVYVEQLTEDGTGVVFNESDVDFVEVDNTFHQVVGGDATRTALYVPHHGPVMGIDTDEGTAVTLRWTGNLMTTDVNYLTEMMAASNVTEAREAIRNVTSIGQNWVVIDTAGNFGWFPFNSVPLRPWASAASPAFLPLDGTGGMEWEGFIDYDDLPQAFNPAKGYLATANNDFTGANLDGDPTNDGHPLLQSYVAVGYRHERIVDLLEATDQHTPETMLETVGDTYSLLGEHVSPALLAVDRASLSAEAQVVYDAIDDWSFDCPTGLESEDPEGDAVADQTELDESLGCLAFHRVFNDAYRGWSADERSAHSWNRRPETDSFLRALLRPGDLTNPDLFWDDVSTEGVTETQTDILSQAFEDAADRLETLLGDDPADWQWGRLHTMRLRADLFSSFGLDIYDEGPFAKNGGLFTVNVANVSVGSDNLTFGSGPSMRLVCEAPDSGVTCVVQLPGGQPHFRTLDEYLGMIDRWFINEPTDLPFDHAAITATAIVGNPPAQ